MKWSWGKSKKGEHITSVFIIFIVSTPSMLLLTILLIRPFCITILYHNLLLFMDIFHMRMQYLYCFILFCMFDDCWWFDCRSPESAGKNTVKILNFCNSRHFAKIQRLLFRRKMRGSRRSTIGGHRVPRRHPGATPPLAVPGAHLAALCRLRLPPFAYMTSLT